MAEPVWGQLDKALDDDEKIEEAIARLITAHNNNANAHIGAGKSLNTHKTQTVVDHPADSIVNDKIKTGEISQFKLSSTEIQIYSCFDSLDGWEKSVAGVDYGVGGVMLFTNGDINNERFLSAVPSIRGHAHEYTKDVTFQTTVALNIGTNVLAYFLTGPCEFGVEDIGFGFKMEDEKLYAIVVKLVLGARTEFTTEIIGYTLTDKNVYKAVWDPTASKVYFYVNGTLEHTESTNLPEGITDTFFTYYVKAKAALVRSLFTNYLLLARKI